MNEKPGSKGISLATTSILGQTPRHAEGLGEEKLAAFEQTFATLKLRIEKMLELPLETMPADELTIELNKVGQLNA